MKRLVFIAIVFSAVSAFSQDRLFTYAYQSNVLAKGQKELEVSNIMRTTREKYYKGFDHRLEFEVGLGVKVQTAFYLNYGYSNGIETHLSVDTAISSSYHSFSNEWKIKLTDPVINPIGSALYFEYTLGTNETELEAKLILDKQINKTLQTCNIEYEYELENEFEDEGAEIEVELEKEMKININYALAYQINKNLSVGFEVLDENVKEGSDWEYSILSAGPCFSYNMEGFWINFTCLPQITNLKQGKQELTSYEKLQNRLTFSYVF